MPGRDIKFYNNGIYHIFNKTLNKQDIFRDDKLASRFLEELHYYLSSKTQIRFSSYINLSEDMKKVHANLISIKKHHHVDLFSHNLLPNHFHILVKQKRTNGVSKYVSNLINSLTKYSNTKLNRSGPLFLSPFKAVEIKSREQFIHTFRYIDLNPYSSGIVKNIDDLFTYPWSSLKTYLNKENKKSFINKGFLLGFFNNSVENYKKFLLDHADYQRSLEIIKHAEKFK